MKKVIILVLILAIGLGVAFWVYTSRVSVSREAEDGPVTLSFWGMEDEGVYRAVIASYQGTHPKVKINYTKQSLLNYRTRLQTQLQAGQGPDVFPIHSSWLPMFSGDLSIASENVISEKDFGQVFYPVAKESLVKNGKVYALPYEVNGLALFYNEDILQAAGVGVPSTWQDFMDAARKVTVRNTSGQIRTAGAAMGTALNVDFWPEILATLFLQQPDGNLVTPANVSGSEVLQFYTSFVTDPQNKTWDVTLPSSSQMFKEGRLAFYFAPYNVAGSLQAENPALHFKTAPVPQLPGRQISYGGFWATAVSVRSGGQKEAWEFVKFLELPETLQMTNSTRPYPRVDMAGLQVKDPVMGAYITQAPYYKSWYLNSNTGDAGINDDMIKLYAQAVEDVLQGKDALGTLQNIQTEIQVVLDKYKVSN